jgi:thiol-disulfide isomerase/thioredoxin
VKIVIFFVFLIATLLFTAAVQADAPPELRLRNLQGEAQSLSDYRGRIVVLNFWATWCQPCQKEIPLFVQLHTRYASQGVQFIAASIDDSETQNRVPDFVRRHGIPFQVWVGATPQDQFSFRLAKAIPATVILDRNGNSVFRIIGEAHRDVLLERLDWLLSERSNPAPSELILPAGVTPEHFRKHELGIEEKEEEEKAETGGSEVPS